QKWGPARTCPARSAPARRSGGLVEKRLVRHPPAPPRSQRAGTKSGDDVVALGREEVAVERTRDACTRGEASPAQHLARVEPRLGIIFVWVGGEAGERHEIRRRPFPHIADHLPASED